MTAELRIVGGGLAGSEAAWQAAEHGVRVILYEMRPDKTTGAHRTDQLAELVCSNSLGSSLPDRAGGLLKEELRLMKSLLLECAEKNAVPAGDALAVDRSGFAMEVTRRIAAHPNIRLIREEIVDIPEGPAIIASGPLTSEGLSRSIASLTGESHLYFFDAIAPIVAADSIDMEIAFCASRYDKGRDYLNCPMSRPEYGTFVDALVGAQRIELKPFEKELEQGVSAGADQFFEGCLPVEIMARRGGETLAFGPMRPVGLIDPRTGCRPYAVVQLRKENLAADMYNLVGFQTNLTYPEQERVFRLIPGLKQAEFERYGQMHRNTFIASPKLLLPTLQYRGREELFFAGQIIGVEGYMGNIATGLLAGINASRMLCGETPWALPAATMIGALCHYVTHADLSQFQPMKANYGILEPLPAPAEIHKIPLSPVLVPLVSPAEKSKKRRRALAYSRRALAAMQAFLENSSLKS